MTVEQFLVILCLMLLAVVAAWINLSTSSKTFLGWIMRTFSYFICLASLLCAVAYLIVVILMKGGCQ